MLASLERLWRQMQTLKMVPQIVILEAHHSNPGDQSWGEIANIGHLTVHQRTSQGQIVERGKEADILITNKLKITADIMDALPKLKLIHQLATGTDNIDKPAALARGIEVKNAIGYSTHAVAQHAFSLIFELVNHVAMHHEDVQSGGWSESGDWCRMLKTPLELFGKNLGVIGFGQIGQAVAKLGQSFGMNILVVSDHANEGLYPDVSVVSLEELAQKSDVVSIHSPLTETNMGIINKDFISNMKSSSYLINTARGGHVVESDLRDALITNRIAGAGLDVLSSEPPEKDNPLVGLRNCIITPHIAWTAYESRKRLISIVANNIKSFLEN